MPSVNDVLQHIAQDFNSRGWKNRSSVSDEAAIISTFAISIAITTDIEEAELNFLERYGLGRTFYFRIKRYEDGKGLAADLYRLFRREEPNMSSYTGERFKPEDQLYLFLHLKLLPVADG